jgi:hypothetical protein
VSLVRDTHDSSAFTSNGVKLLRLERFAYDLPESFLFLELGELEPSGVYEREDDDQDLGSVTDPALQRSLKRMHHSEELVDVGGGVYLEREVWDRGYVDHYDDPLPRNARRIHRLLRGNVMIACKAMPFRIEWGHRG